MDTCLLLRLVLIAVNISIIAACSASSSFTRRDFLYVYSFENRAFGSFECRTRSASTTLSIVVHVWNKTLLLQFELQLLLLSQLRLALELLLNFVHGARSALLSWHTLVLLSLAFAASYRAELQELELRVGRFSSDRTHVDDSTTALSGSSSLGTLSWWLVLHRMVKCWCRHRACWSLLQSLALSLCDKLVLLVCLQPKLSLEGALRRHWALTLDCWGAFNTLWNHAQWAWWHAQNWVRDQTLVNVVRLLLLTTRIKVSWLIS